MLVLCYLSIYLNVWMRKSEWGFLLFKRDQCRASLVTIHFWIKFSITKPIKVACNETYLWVYSTRCVHLPWGTTKTHEQFNCSDEIWWSKCCFLNFLTSVSKDILEMYFLNMRKHWHPRSNLSRRGENVVWVMEGEAELRDGSQVRGNCIRQQSTTLHYWPSHSPLADIHPGSAATVSRPSCRWLLRHAPGSPRC